MKRTREAPRLSMYRLTALHSCAHGPVLLSVAQSATSKPRKRRRDSETLWKTLGVWLVCAGAQWQQETLIE